MPRPRDLEKYQDILLLELAGFLHREIPCSPNTIQNAKEWGFQNQAHIDQKNGFLYINGEISGLRQIISTRDKNIPLGLKKLKLDSCNNNDNNNDNNNNDDNNNTNNNNNNTTNKITIYNRKGQGSLIDSELRSSFSNLHSYNNNDNDNIKDNMKKALDTYKESNNILTTNSIFEQIIIYTKGRKGKGYERMHKILSTQDKNRNFQSNIIKDFLEILIEMRLVAK